MGKIHIWIGTTTKSEEEYLNYFKLDYSTAGDFDDPEYRLCPFCKDIGEMWYDEDMIGIIPVFPAIEPVAALLQFTPMTKDGIVKALHACNTSGVVEGNAIFYYTDSALVTLEPFEKLYNDLQYIGCYESLLN